MVENFEFDNLENKDRYDKLKKEWLSIFKNDNINIEEAEAVFQEIYELMTGEDRHYHNIDHVQRVLAFIKNEKDKIENYQAMQLAAWFHDAIYDTKAKDNEEKSAELSKERLSKLGLSKDLVDRVYDLVMVTKRHNHNYNSEDFNIFIDADLETLGVPEEEYDSYYKAIRKEYSWVSDEDFKEGRRKFCQYMLQQDRIYKTDRMYKLYEEQARNNLTRELKNLR